MVGGVDLVDNGKGESKIVKDMEFIIDYELEEFKDQRKKDRTSRVKKDASRTGG